MTFRVLGIFPYSVTFKFMYSSFVLIQRIQSKVFDNILLLTRGTFININAKVVGAFCVAACTNALVGSVRIPAACHAGQESSSLCVLTGVQCPTALIRIW